MILGGFFSSEELIVKFSVSPGCFRGVLFLVIHGLSEEFFNEILANTPV